MSSNKIALQVGEEARLCNLIGKTVRGYDCFGKVLWEQPIVSVETELGMRPGFYTVRFPDNTKIVGTIAYLEGQTLRKEV